MITDSFDDKTPPIVNLYDFYGERKKLADICLITFSRKIFQKIPEEYQCKQIACIEAANGEWPIYCFDFAGRRIAFYLSAIGSAAASEFAIEANWLTGAEKFIMFGSAGSLDKEITANKYIVPTAAYRDEGMSYHYAPAADYIDIKNSDVMVNFFKELNIPYACGKVWTTDAFLRETVGEYKKRKAEGCIAVEMELAGVQSVCDYHGWDLYNFIVTGDVLSENDYSVGGLSSANHDMDKFNIALEIAKRI